MGINYIGLNCDQQKQPWMMESIQTPWHPLSSIGLFTWQHEHIAWQATLGAVYLVHPDMTGHIMCSENMAMEI